MDSVHEHAQDTEDHQADHCGVSERIHPPPIEPGDLRDQRHRAHTHGGGQRSLKHDILSIEPQIGLDQRSHLHAHQGRKGIEQEQGQSR